MPANPIDIKYEFEVVIERVRDYFRVFVPALPEINTFGNTFDHGLEMATEAIELSLEYRHANDLPVPSTPSRQIRMVKVSLPVIS